MYHCSHFNREVSIPVMAAAFMQGEHETQMYIGGEATLHGYLNLCEKNPGHKSFIPVHQFRVEHLPEGHHDLDLYDLIKVYADLTVRVTVNCTSPCRPCFWPNTRQSYPFNNRGTASFSRSGSGLVWQVTKRSSDGQVCPCPECQSSGEPSKVWAEVIVFTATHVVFNEPEARNTVCRLFYNTRDCPLVTLKGFTVNTANIEADRCEMQCATCDLELITRLVQLKDDFNKLWTLVYEKFRQTRDMNRLLFVISHPHGCHKQISIGRWVHRHQSGRDGSVTRFTYTASTCPGCSGASVYLLGYRSDQWLFDQHVHSGSITPGLNCSGSGYTYG